ncbi:MAG: serine peptidase, partial [Bradyrhizobium canariense]
MSQNFRSRALASVAAVAIVASGAVGAALYEGQPAFAQTAKAPITVNAQAPATFADVVDQVKPAVVSVRVKVENAMTDGDGLPSSQLENVPPQLR